MSAWIISEANRLRVVKDVLVAEPGVRVVLTDEDPRTSGQNRTMWRLLAAFSKQVEHCGRYYDRETWKAILMHAFGREISFVPSLDGQAIVAIGYRSSKLTREEMSNFIEFVYSEGARLSVDFDNSRPVEAVPA